MEQKKRNALISVFDKTGIENFALELHNLGFNLYASGGTFKKIWSHGIPVINVAELVGGDAILGHRVVTLSREIHAGLLARPQVDADVEELEKLSIPFLDLVYCNMYPLVEEIAKPEATLESVIEQTDIGGPTMIRSAVKGRRIVACDAQDLSGVISYIKNGEKDKKFLQYLVAKAEFRVSAYVLASACYHGEGKYFGILGERVDSCQYGENAYQTADIYSTGSDDPLALDKFKTITDNKLSYNNRCDLDRMLNTLTHIAAGFVANYPGKEIPNIAVAVKHGNPCGASYGYSKEETLRKTVMGDPRAIFGGLVITNFQIGIKEAEILMHYKVEGKRRLLDAIVAPSYSNEAFDVLSKRKKCRLVVNEALGTKSIAELDQDDRFRYARGGFLVQSNYNFVLKMHEAANHNGALVKHEKSSLILAWAIGCTSNSNTITLVRENYLIGNGVGQQSRIECCELADKKATDAQHQLKGAVAYSDSFFPFTDGPEALKNAGVTTILTSSGSVKDDEVIDYCKRNNITLRMIPDKIARGFFGH